MILFWIFVGVVSACLIVWSLILWAHRPRDWHASTENPGACCVCFRELPAGQVFELVKVHDDTGIDAKVSMGGGTFTAAPYCADDCPCGKVHVRAVEPARPRLARPNFPPR